MSQRSSMPDSSAKAELRTRMRELLRGLPATQLASESQAVSQRIREHPRFRSASSVMLFLPMHGVPEVDLTLAFQPAAGKRFFAPRVDWAGRTMAAAEILIDPATAAPRWVRGPRGLLEPGPDAPTVEPRQLDLIIVPGLAFDPFGGRLGRGAGFYDRFLSEIRGHQPRPALWGAALACQMVDRVPRDVWDIPLDAVAASDRWIAITQDA